MLPQLTSGAAVCFSGWQLPVLIVFSIWGAVYFVISIALWRTRMKAPTGGEQ